MKKIYKSVNIKGLHISLMDSRFVCLQRTLGIVFQDSRIIRLCFIWWHIVINWMYLGNRK